MPRRGSVTRKSPSPTVFLKTLRATGLTRSPLLRKKMTATAQRMAQDNDQNSPEVVTDGTKAGHHPLGRATLARHGPPQLDRS